MHDRVVKYLSDNRYKLVSIIFPQPMEELIRVCSSSFMVKQELFDCMNIKSRDSSSIEYWKLFRRSMLMTGVDLFEIEIDSFWFDDG